MGVRRIHYLGTIYDIETKVALLKHAKIFVLPSKMEVFPLSVLEAMLQGVPTITISSGCLPEVIDNGINGFLCRHKSDFEKYIKVLIEDDNLRKRIGLKAREKIRERFLLSKVKKKLIQIYKETMELSENE